MLRRRATLATLGAVVAVTILACVDLDALGSGGERPKDAGGVAERFCGPDAGALFCDDFDEPERQPGDLWPGLPGILPSPSVAGAAGFERVSASVGRVPASSAPHAVSFFARYEPGEPRPLVAFSRAFEVGEVSGGAVVLSADLLLEELTELGDASADAAVADAHGDASANDASKDAARDALTDAPNDAPTDATQTASDAAVAEDPQLPMPHVSVAGLLAVGGPGSGVGGAQLTLTNPPTGAGLYLVTGNDNATVRRVRVTTLNYLRAADLAWVRVFLVAGTPDAVRAFAKKNDQLVTCPDTPAVAAAWASLPPGQATCIANSASFVDLPKQRVAATIGSLVEAPSTVRLRVDSVRVDVLR